MEGERESWRVGERESWRVGERERERNGRRERELERYKTLIKTQDMLT